MDRTLAAVWKVMYFSLITNPARPKIVSFNIFLPIMKIYCVLVPFRGYIYNGRQRWTQNRWISLHSTTKNHTINLEKLFTYYNNAPREVLEVSVWLLLIKVKYSNHPRLQQFPVSLFINKSKIFLTQTK